MAASVEAMVLEEGSDTAEVKRPYVPPAIVEEVENLPAYTRSYSNTCSHLPGSCTGKFFNRLKK